MKSNRVNPHIGQVYAQGDPSQVVFRSHLVREIAGQIFLAWTAQTVYTHFPHATTVTTSAEERGTMPKNFLRSRAFNSIAVHLPLVQYNYKTASITDLTPSLMNKALDTFLDWASKLKGCTGSSMSGSCIKCRYTLKISFFVAIIPCGTLALLA